MPGPEFDKASKLF